MILIPYKVDSEMAGVPIVTTLVALACLLIFLVQQYSWHDYERNVENFCRHEIGNNLDELLTREECLDIFVKLDLSQDRKSTTQLLLSRHPKIKPYSSDIAYQLKRMESIVPNPATIDWWYEPESFNPLSMISSKLSHINWQQLLFNLAFFLAFAITAEQILGHLGFALFLFFSAISTSIIYSLGAMNLHNSAPEIGLSGVVTSTMILATLVYPHRFLKFFFWLIFVSGTFRLPLLLITVGYIGSDMYSITIRRNDTNIYFLSHIAGVLSGSAVAIPLIIFRKYKKRPC